MSIFNDLLAFVLAFPFVATVIFGVIAYWTSAPPKRSVILIVDGSGVFFWVSILALFKVRDPGSEPLIWLLGIFIPLAAGLFFLQYKIRGKIDPFRVFRSIWRVGFLVSIIMYFWLITDTIGMYMDMV
jgi:Protein of unknown function (DUF3397)